jgi:hypothetical protein
MPAIKITTRSLRSLLKRRFSGLLRSGSHSENGECCVLELASVAMGIPWTDSPEGTRTWDLRSLNDIAIPGDVRALHLVPVLAKYAGSMDWPKERQIEVASKLAIGTVREIVSRLPRISEAVAAQCRNVTDLDSAYTAAASAASAAASAAARSADAASAAARSADAAAAARSADAAADAARYAADAAADAAAASEEVFVRSCKVWLDAVA